MHPLNLDKSKKYSIVGAPKSGTSSLGEFMRREMYDVTEDELYFDDIEHYPHTDRIPIVILREPIERAWSDYLFFGSTPEANFHTTLKECCEWSKYGKHLKNWPNAIIFYFEDLIQLPDFPHHNRNPKKPKIDEASRKIIMDELKDDDFDWASERSAPVSEILHFSREGNDMIMWKDDTFTEHHEQCRCRECKGTPESTVTNIQYLWEFDDKLRLGEYLHGNLCTKLDNSWVPEK